MWLKNIHCGHVLGFAALLAPTLGVFGPLLVAPLAIATILGLLAIHLRDDDSARPDAWFVSIVGFLLVWTSLSLLWSINFNEALGKWAVIGATAAVIFYLLVHRPNLAEHERHLLRRFVVAGIVLGYLLIFFELATTNAISRYVLDIDSNKVATVELFNRTDSVLFMFVWPAVAILWRNWIPAALALIALGLVTGYLLPSASALIGYAAGTVVFLGALWAPRVVSAALAVAVVVAIMTAPLLPGAVPYLDPEYPRRQSPDVNASLIHRLDIWKFTIERIAERPFLGWGFNAARAVPGGDEHYYLRDSTQRIVGQGNRLPLHPHNGALQVWLELGLPGAVGFAALFGLTAVRAGRAPDRANRAMALALVATTAPIWMLSFGIWQGWWLGVITLSALLTVALATEERSLT